MCASVLAGLPELSGGPALADSLSFEDRGSTEAQKRVGAALDRISASPPATLAPLFTTLGTLSTSQVPNALDAVGGAAEGYTGLASVMARTRRAGDQRARRADLHHPYGRARGHDGARPGRRAGAVDLARAACRIRRGARTWWA
ncbi:MAG: hypothetical protein WDO24_29685 [Pseudomonadota bacterium]